MCTYIRIPICPTQKFFPQSLTVAPKNGGKELHPECAMKIAGPATFSSSGRVPEIDGVLYMKDGYRKPWKKFYFMLRASGLYQSTKGKSTVRGPTHLMHTYMHMYVYTYVHTYVHTYVCVFLYLNTYSKVCTNCTGRN